MTTRWYLRSDIPSAPVGGAYPFVKKAANAGTTGLGVVGTRAMGLTKGSGAVSSAGNATGNIYCNTWIGPALAPQTISGSVAVAIGEARGTSGAVDIAAFVYLWRPSGAGSVVAEIAGDGAGGFQTIGAFTGTIRTLTLNAKATIKPVPKDNDKAPDYRVTTAAGVEFCAGWSKNSREDRAYVSLKLDDPDCVMWVSVVQDPSPPPLTRIGLQLQRVARAARRPV